MSFVEKLMNLREKNGSHLCVGLDIDPERIQQNPVSFCKKIIAETKEYVCAYKANLGFYLAMGEEGIEILKEVVAAIPPEIPWILDAKFGDIANSSSQYARFAYEVAQADAVTLNPYMGFDSIKAFAKYEDRYAFILTLTSNQSAADFQTHDDLSLKVAKKIGEWRKGYKNLGMVLGATQGEKLMPLLEGNDSFVLVPGIGSQGGSVDFLRDSEHYERLIINVSRSIIYAENISKSCEEFYNLTYSK
ncbi:hypothetical protein AT15_03080 [Kosmotoga arenicorallina S304]|uniref:Orotidine-5'-phosphate decarboxylase n=1 Tax=Kosmotoga arenicorallina S304 TaxID=1453497 RepID=A0A182C7W6_9BACT|nr:orotidine-5'-phosphate decarboxylase [Kosmotoga arenicorallina]OAA31828.1 hypothetical protein AT15_03080 [Kosmotoga arenicorallina S304]